MNIPTTLDFAWFESHRDHDARMRPATEAELLAGGVDRFDKYGFRAWAIVRRTDGAVTLLAMRADWPDDPGGPERYALMSDSNLAQLFSEPKYVIAC